MPYQLLSDAKLELAEKLGLPTFEWEGKKLHKRLTMAVEDGVVVKVWYPVFPPDKNAEEVLSWMEGKEGKGRGLGTTAQADILKNMGTE